MLTRAAACLVVALLVSLAAADDADSKKNAKAQAEECQTALLKGDYDRLTDLTHPKIVEGAGGRKKMIEKVSTELKGLKEKGVAFKSVAVGAPSDPVKAGKELYLVVPFTLELTLPGGKATSPGALLGISTDGGKSWVFADTSPGRDTMKKVFPDLPDAVVIPKKEPPKFFKD